MLFDACTDYWNQVINSADAKQKSEMQNWLLKNCNGRLNDFAEDILIDVLLNNFNEPEFLKKNLMFLQKRIETAPSYAVSNMVVHSIELMQELNYPEKEIEEFHNKYRYIPDVRKMEISQAISENNYDKAVELLRESIIIDKDKIGLVKEYEQKIIEIYENNGTPELYCQELQNYITSYSQSDTVYVNKFKKCISEEEWNNTLDFLLGLPTVKNIRWDIMTSENMCRELLEELKNERMLSLFTFCRYDDVLRKQMPEATLAFYSMLLCKAMDNSYTRDHYKNVVSHFSRMKNYDGGQRQIEILVQLWKDKYPRRTAMIEEINKVLK